MGKGNLKPETETDDNAGNDYIAADPCHPDKNNVMLPNATDKSLYFICYKGVGYPGECQRPKVFDAKKSVCVDP